MLRTRSWRQRDAEPATARCSLCSAMRCSAVVTHEQLMRAHVRATRRNAVRIDDALEQVGAGVRSLPEGDFRRLAEQSTVLPTLLYNRKLQLPDRSIIAPDAQALYAADPAVIMSRD